MHGGLEKNNDKETPANADGHADVWSEQTGSGADKLVGYQCVNQQGH